MATDAKETAVVDQATRRVRTKSSTLLIVSREPGTCGTCRHANQGTADFQEGYVFCQFGGGALPVTHSCDKRMPAFRAPNTNPELYYCYEPFTGNNCTWQKLEDTRVLASDANDEMRNSLQGEVSFIPASTASS